MYRQGKEERLPTSGETCQVSGIYKVMNHVAHPKEITMVEGKIFPPCRKCDEKVDYELKPGPNTEHSFLPQQRGLD